MSALYDTVASILTATLKVPVKDLRPDATLEELVIDSLALVELVMSLEENSGVAIADDKLTLDLTLSEAVGVLAAEGAIRHDSVPR